MLFRVLADLAFLAHLGFIVFVVLGGLLAFRWRRVAWLHVPAALWAVALECFALGCPLTPLEIRLRRAAGETGFSEGFVEHYVLPIVYPGAMTREVQLALGAGVCAVNGAVYVLLWRRTRRRRAEEAARGERR